MKKMYITTAIDYVNSLPHIGTAYEKIGADVLARYYRLQGYDVYFQMGNDEHSVNVFKAALNQKLDPHEYCKQMRKKFEDVWKQLDISYDYFIQTSDETHKTGLQKLCDIILKKGDIFKSRYEGWYCESCEAFYTDKDLVGGECPNHKSKPKWLSEENYFFKLSKYRDPLLKHIKKHPDFILPESRRNEILNLLESGLNDISISRSSVEWGVELPADPKEKIYVWVDALTNYITGIGYGSDEQKFKKWWPAQLHIIGKDITRFHCVVWPALLMSAGLELPKTIFGHGFIHMKGEKMSKTLGNVIRPLDVTDNHGADPLRYFLLREAGFGRDGDFTWETFINRYNAELANGLGNFVSRTLGMIRRYQDGKVEPVKVSGEMEDALIKNITSIAPAVERALDHTTGEIDFHVALAAIQEGIAHCDRYINEKKPWVLAKEAKGEEIAKVLFVLMEAIRIIVTLLIPFIPSTSKKIWSVCGFDAIKSFDEISWQDATKSKMIETEIVVKESDSFFPRIEKEEEPKKEEEKVVESQKKGGSKMLEQISIMDFAKVDLRVAKILEASRIEGTDRLMKITVTLGDEERQIVAGIAQHYTAEDLKDKMVVVVANLQPAKLKGVESHGMLLAASDDNTVSILTPFKDVKVGSKVK
ncbi:MAG: methionine--tRNA ligase [Pseudomonadota bacterium]